MPLSASSPSSPLAAQEGTPALKQADTPRSQPTYDLLKGAVLLQGAVTSITEPAAADMTYAFGLFYGGFVQLLAGMWEMYKVCCIPQAGHKLGSACGSSGKICSA